MFIDLNQTDLRATSAQPKTGILVAVATLQQPMSTTEAYVEELAFLANTWGVSIIKIFIQKLDRPHRSTLVGKGKLAEIADFIKAENVNYAIFDDELSPSQVRNLEKSLACETLDRSLLILHIFSMRAQTKQARTQVALAQYQYLLPRLTRLWTHLTSQKGGSAGMRGPGEKELETDKRIVQNKIATLRTRLQHIEKQCITRRKSRIDMVRVALVGYTNVGKSTLMRLLSKSDVLADNKLFATVDATVRRVTWDNSKTFLLTDTVGFIRKLPHTLVACFKSTLEEIKEADLLLHVIDSSHPCFQEQIKIVNKTLSEIGVQNLPQILIYNKVDIAQQIELATTCPTAGLLEERLAPQIEALQKAHQEMYKDTPAVFISATEHFNLDMLKETINRCIATTIEAKKDRKTLA